MCIDKKTDKNDDHTKYCVKISYLTNIPTSNGNINKFISQMLKLERVAT